MSNVLLFDVVFVLPFVVTARVFFPLDEVLMSFLFAPAAYPAV